MVTQTYSNINSYQLRPVYFNLFEVVLSLRSYLLSLSFSDHVGPNVGPVTLWLTFTFYLSVSWYIIFWIYHDSTSYITILLIDIEINNKYISIRYKENSIGAPIYAFFFDQSKLTFVEKWHTTGELGTSPVVWNSIRMFGPPWTDHMNAWMLFEYSILENSLKFYMIETFWVD